MGSPEQPNHAQLIAHYESEYDQLMHIGRYYCIEKEELKDIIHQLFLHFAEKNINLELIANPRSYIITSFKRRLIDYHRTSSKKEFNLNFSYQDFSELSIDKKIEETEQHLEIAQKLKAIYEKLPGRCKKVIYLKYYDGLNNSQIMSQTGLSLRSVYNNLSEGIKLMRAEMIVHHPQREKLTLMNLLPYIFCLF